MSFFSAIFGTFITDPEGEGRRGNSLAWPCIEQLSKQLKNEWMNGAQLRLGLPSCTPLPPPPLPPSLCLCWTVRDGGAASWLYAARKWLAHMLVQPSKANPACCFSLSCCCWATCANACPRNVGVEVILGHNIPATMCHHDHRQGCHVFIYEPDSTIQGQLGSNSTTFSSSNSYFLGRHRYGRPHNFLNDPDEEEEDEEEPLSSFFFASFFLWHLFISFHHLMTSADDDDPFSFASF